ncbi:MAG: YveK family protein [Eubacteriales bacterium]
MLDILKKRLFILIVIPMVAVIAACAVSIIMAPVYRAIATIMIAVPVADGSVSDYNSLILNRQLVKTYAALALEKDSLQEVAGQLKGISPDELEDRITVSPVKDLELLRISVIDENPERAAFIANKTVDVLWNKTKLLYENDNIKVISYARIPNKQDKPYILVNIAAAFLAGLIVAIIISFWLEDKSFRARQG